MVVSLYQPVDNTLIPIILRETIEKSENIRYFVANMADNQVLSKIILQIKQTTDKVLTHPGTIKPSTKT